MIESADKEYYGFEYSDCDGKVYKTKIESSENTWHEVLEDFVNFLQTIYKYDIKSQVRVQEPIWFEHLNEWERYNYQGWQGEYFVKDDEEDTE